MKFTMNEVAFLNAVTGGGRVFKVDLKYPKEETEKIGIEIVSSLKVKGIISENNEFTKDGFITLSIFKAYREAKTHYAVNQLNLASLDNYKMISIAKTKDDEFDINYTDAFAVMRLILNTSSFMCKDSASYEQKHSEKISVYDWIDTLPDFIGRMLVINKYEDFRAVEGKVFYWSDTGGHIYNPKEEKYRQLKPMQMRRLVADMLGINKELIAKYKM